MFDYLYYKACLYYKNRPATNTSFEWYGLCLLSGMQMLNLLTLIYGLCLWWHKLPTHLVALVLGALALFIIINIKRHNSITFDNLEQRYSNDENYATKGFLVLLYIIFSPIALFCVAKIAYLHLH